jgi:flagellar hook protein FlgE
LLSRAGSFTVDRNNTLVNPDGYQVLGTDGKPITFVNTGLAANSATDFSKITSIAPNGVITYLASDGLTSNYYSGSGVAGVPVSTTSAAAAALLPTVALVKAADPSGLAKVGSSLYQATAAAGVPATPFTLAGNQPNGTSEQVVSNTLEQSNVDMASEFVNMITTQRAYSANSKTITTTDQMTQDVLALIR